MRRSTAVCTVAYILIGLGSASILHAQRGSRIRIDPRRAIEGPFPPKEIRIEPYSETLDRDRRETASARWLDPPGWETDSSEPTLHLRAWGTDLFGDPRRAIEGPFPPKEIRIEPDSETLDRDRRETASGPWLDPLGWETDSWVPALDPWKAHAFLRKKRREAIAREDFWIRIWIRDFPWSEEARAAFFSEHGHERTAKLSGELRTAIYSAIENIQKSSWLADLKQLPEKEYLDAKAGVSNKEIFAKLRQGGNDPEHVRKLQELSADIERLTPYERKVLDVVVAGADPEQVRLSADLLHSKEALNDGLDQEVISCAEAARLRCIGSAFVQPADFAKNETDFYKQSLRNMLFGLEYAANARTFNGPIEQRLALIRAFLRDSDELEQYHSVIGEISHFVLKLCDSQFIFDLNLEAPAWERMQLHNALPELQGFFKDENGVVLFIGDDNPRAIQIHPSGEVELCSPRDGDRLFNEYCSKAIKENSNPSMELFYTYGTPLGQVVGFPDGLNVTLQPQELSLLEQGFALPQEHALSKHLSSGKPQVLFSTPFMSKQGEPFRNAEDFAYSLVKSYPKARVCMDPFSDQTSQHLDALMNFIVNASAIKVVITGKSNPIPQGKTITNIVDELRGAQLDVTVFTGSEHYTGESGKAVFVITGHSSVELADLVRQLGEGGFFKGNFVIFNSCNTPLTHQLAVEINGLYGACATFAFSDKIMAADVENYMLELAHSLSSDRHRPLVDILNQAVLKHKMTGLFKICQVNTEGF